ncbi:ABC transporter permease [Litchfieldia salsa]|uniref:Putative ABC transport system permease protein n=1 Tax=Litchfieldia salsa TaxID=930152 RepID=A0A1H0UE38_9BACI|nr:ABC transporter permease [Litchfieldia salsa]SDP64449.1 putative ABC transport system permease protein [Litchfieldia salsa]
MSIWESFKIALSSIWNHKIRSILTMLGIIIGVAAVIIIVAIGQGARKQMTEELFSTDKNAIELFYEFIPVEGETEEEMNWMPPQLNSDDMEMLSEVPGVKAVLGTNQGWGTMVHGDQQGDMQITGVGAEYFSAKNLQIVEGRAFFARDVDGLNRVVMIDTVARERYFPSSNEAIGEIVDLNGNPYKVVGVYESPIPEQYRQEEGMGEMLMPRTVISLMFGNMEIESLSVIASDPEKISETGRLAADTLTEKKKLENGMYTIYDQSEYEQEVNTVITIMTLVIGSIAGISLLVGGIGVMNIMLVSVTERTREIGLRKALGATRGKILLQFLIESATLTSLGGILGIGLASVGTIIVTNFAPISASVSPLIALIGVGFSAFVGVIFGILPANKASKLSPIDALRYE